MTSPVLVHSEVREVVFRLAPFGSRAYFECVVLREKVLRRPLGLQFHPQDLMQEKNDWHLGFWLQNRCIATLSLKPLDKATVKMRQVCVDPAFQKQGLGTALVRLAETFAQSMEYKTILLHARKDAIPFYKRLGYKPISNWFLEVGIPHKKMIKILKD